MNSSNPQATGLATRPVPTTFPQMLDRFKGEIARALPKHLDGDRMARVALTCFNSSPRLRECEPRSVFASIIIASQLGLEPGVMGQCYLIPYKNSRTNRYECQLQVGYQGLVDLVRRSGLVKRIETHVVHANDVFEYSIGLENKLLHRPVLDGDPGAPRLAYAVAEFKDGGVHVEVMTAHEIFAIRDRSQNVISGKRFNKKTPWDTDLEEMMRKTVARRICKMLPKSASLATALAIDNAADRGTQAIDIDDAIDDTWAAPMDDEVAIAGNEPAIANAQADAGLMPRAKSDAADAQQAADAPAAAPRRRRRARKTDADERSSLEIMRDPFLQRGQPDKEPASVVAPHQGPVTTGEPISDALEKLLCAACAEAGVPRAEVANRYGPVTSLNYNRVRNELLAMADATRREAEEGR